MFIEKISEIKIFHRICDATRGALCRFPLAVLFFFWMSIVVFDGELSTGVLSDDWRVITFCYFLLAGTLAAIVQLAGELRQLSALKLDVIQAFAQIVFLAIYWQHVQYPAQVWGLGLAFFMLFLSVPALKRSVGDDTVWFFNYRVLLGASFGLILSAVAAFAFTMLFASIKHMLDLNIRTSGWVMPFASLFMVIFPLCVLSMVPADIEEKDTETTILRGMKFILEYVFIPFLLLYTAIFYAGIVRWIFAGFNRDAGWSIVGFLYIGLAAYIFSFYFRTRGTWILRFFVKHFYNIAIIPIITLAIFLARKFSGGEWKSGDYVTALSGAAFLVLVLLHIFRYRADRLVFIPLVAAFFLMVFSVGPLNGARLDILLRKEDLKKSLISYGVLDQQTGLISSLDPPKEIEHLASDALMNGVMYFARRNALKELKEWIDPVADRLSLAELCAGDGVSRRVLIRPVDCSVSATSAAEEILKAWGVVYVKPQQVRFEQLGFTRGKIASVETLFPRMQQDKEAVLATHGYENVMRGHLSWGRSSDSSGPPEVEELIDVDGVGLGIYIVKSSDGKVGIRTNEQNTSWVSMYDTLDDFFAQNGDPHQVDKKRGVFFFDTPDYSAELSILNMGYYKGKETHVSTLEYILRFTMIGTGAVIDNPAPN